MAPESNDPLIMLLSDDQDEADALSRHLSENMGFRMLVAGNVDEARALLDRQQDLNIMLFDLHVMDQPSDQSGIEFMWELKTRLNPPSIIGYSSFVQSDLSTSWSQVDGQNYPKIFASTHSIPGITEQIKELIDARRSGVMPDTFGAQISSALEPVQAAWDEVCKYLAQNPNHLHQMDPRRFEELVAEMFRSHGWIVELTARTSDGGYDIVALKEEKLTGFRLLVEAKRWSPDRPVGVGIVRSLYGLRGSQSASKVILATSSTVSTVSKMEFQRVIPWELDFIERDAILDWCKAYPQIRLLGELGMEYTSI